jgi:hypothetical protein
MIRQTGRIKGVEEIKIAHKNLDLKSEEKKYSTNVTGSKS